MHKTPKAIYKKNAQVSLPYPLSMPSMLDSLTSQQLAAYKALPENERRATTAELRYNLRKEFTEKLQTYYARLQYEVRDVTWEERAENLKRCILRNLCSHVQNRSAVDIKRASISN